MTAAARWPWRPSTPSLALTRTLSLTPTIDASLGGVDLTNPNPNPNPNPHPHPHTLTLTLTLTLTPTQGAGAVLGAARVLAEERPEGVETHFIIASCENMVSANPNHGQP